ncbi:MAG TPA: HD domain-containing phosphohydrolase [Thermodesulfovibrionales bacterium]|nr:HD domain-containing phosphohydrolase [Thermodesulfovibrionales bacterium]
MEKTTELISHVMTALSNSALYSGEHPVVDEFTGKAMSLLDTLYRDDSLSITLLGNRLVMNDAPLNEKSTHLENFIKRLRRKGLERIIIRKGVDQGELKTFISRMASEGDVTSTPHLSVGIVEVKFRDERGDTRGLIENNIAKVKETYQGISKFKSLEMVGLEEAVAGFITALREETDLLRIMSPVKSYSEYTYVHASNVSVLTLFQADALGVKGESLYDIGLAGLLHDAGKMLVPKEILDKQGKLSEAEWDEMKKHPVHGAMYLSTLPDVPKLAVIAAFEHHMKFNGSGYPDTKGRGKKQHILSQMVAISDFFDALRTVRPYRKPLEVSVIVGLLKEGTGRDFNPFLIENFLVALKRIKVI